MSRNGSPGTRFYTDEEKTLFLVTLPVHLQFVGAKSVDKLLETIRELNTLESFDTLISHLDDDLWAQVKDAEIEQMGPDFGPKSAAKINQILHLLTTPAQAGGF